MAFPIIISAESPPPTREYLEAIQRAKERFFKIDYNKEITEISEYDLLYNYTDFFCSYNKENGQYKIYYPHGQIQSIENCLNGERHGQYKKWYENGNKWIDANYNKGKLDGQYQSWFEDGTIYWNVEYINGVRRN